MYHFFRQLWLVLGVKLMEINSNWFSRLAYLSLQLFAAMLDYGSPRKVGHKMRGLAGPVLNVYYTTAFANFY